ncbi:uncharacterized protein ACA1_379150 [Acanthamoeba castellanii str. Neff]|uniref:Uncharacterized protein n=1 Tax=Acanthamoeba castellanii (strain ATCC 30010 / Neff) TaxID=1257118 RepID=L8GRF0_ACACF|nr:uncharacterized protein ACA1_379150 [Acanthamoeba castellanii str. Neff]ELR15734.1 hypothetical protein ACA1_379150 [Acanthamoeba castellanii str. Neff]
MKIMKMSHPLLLVIGLATFVLLATHFLGGPWEETEAEWRAKNKGMLRVAVFESTGWHDEVVAALVYALGQQPSTALTLYLKAQRYGIDQIYAAFAPRASFFPAARMRDHLVRGWMPAPDVVVLATGEWDFANHTDVFHHLFTSSPHTYLLCVVHHAAQWEAQAMRPELLPLLRPWVEAGRITFLTLAPHVAHLLSTVVIPTWHLQVSTANTSPLAARVETFVPVFPVAGLAGQRTSVGPGETPFAIQGNFDPARRNYDHILSRLRSDRQAADLTLHLLGSGKGLKLPIEGLDGRVVVDSRLDYLPYYAIIARSVALVPSFATDEYYIERASSTVAASLIAGCPLVANRRLLDTYTYLDESVVWVQEEGEDEMDVVIRVARARSAAERSAKSENVRRRTRELCARSVRQFARWVLEATAARPDIDYRRT